MPSQRRRPGRRSHSQGCCTTSAVAATTVLISLSSTSSALLAAPACFVSHPHTNTNGRAGSHQATLGSTLSKPQHHLSRLPFLQSSPSSRRSRLLAPLAMQNDDETAGPNNHDDDQEEEEEEYTGIKSNLNKISWLPSVKMGHQPFKPSFAQISRKESADGESYESSNSNNAPPGFQNIEILPVLPMTMVHGMDGMLMDTNKSDEDEEETLELIDQDDIVNYINGLDDESSLYGTGVWEEDPENSIISTLGPLFSGTSSYLPHTKGHVFTVAEPRYKKLYDDLLRVGNYYGMKRNSAMRRAKEMESGENEGVSSGSGNAMFTAESLPDPDEKRRFIVTAANPAEEGVFAEYGLLFQLKDLDEVAAVASYEMGGEGGMTMEELQELVESVDIDDNGERVESGSEEDVMDILLRTHYEATHDVVGRVKIHRFVNPECYSEGPDGEEYLMAEATILDVVENDRVKMLEGRKTRAEAQKEQPASLTTARVIEEAKEQAVGEVAKAVARIKEELRSSVSDAFKQQQQLDPEKIKDQLRAALDEEPALKSSLMSNDPNNKSGRKAPIPLGPKGVYVERRSDDSLTKEERSLRESFSKLVSLQHELKEECRFTRVSVQTFGIGPVGVWLSAAAWSQFVEKRLEATHGDMQSDLQAKLVDYMSDRGSDSGIGSYLAKNAEDENSGIEGGMEGTESIDFDDLSLELQQEFQLVQARATEELGPLALERAIQMQRIVQAESYTERVDLLRECVDNERRRLEAKKMLQSLGLDDEGNDVGERGDGTDSRTISREEARSLFERLMSIDEDKVDKPKDFDEEAFQ